ncbi:D-lactate dehydrogenase [Penicillium lagena]|uniref:D-lactate dehydrogenase n=1 Tax=Penicillium lagena TaxID=94218 RepID=UPI00253FE3B1|nr:D-lactate dehydrogenase [Penicillium lagena]KAJ5604477.1 D-lactate dehydrogenase [Penicillium lagena]
MTSLAKSTGLETFLQGSPEIKYIPPNSPDYPAARKVFHAGRRDNPLAIVQPQSPSDVAALIKYAKSSSLPFTIRSGGHNLEGRAIVEGALCIDLRALTAVTVASDRQSATVQGGVLQGDLANKLWAEGLATPTGTIPSVGYVGWATYGGYGPFSSHWGLGVDQILSATIVNHDGDIIHVNADEPLLQGIRGAGGLYGVILDLTIKVYPLTSLLAGAIIFDSSNITKTCVDFNAAYENLLDTEGLPLELTIQQIAFNAPTGRCFGTIFVWSGVNIEEGQYWSEKIASLGPLVANTVAPANIQDWFRGNGALVPPTAFGSSYTHNISRVSPVIAETIGRGLASMPSDPGTMVSIHQLRGPSTEPQGISSSVFEAREPHYMLELLGLTVQKDVQKESEKWAAQMAEDIKQADPDYVLPSAYVSLYATTVQATSPAKTLEKTYGSKVEVLKALKAKFDPENVFSLAIPALK